MAIKNNYIIKQLNVNHWRQFNRINMSLHPRVNIIAGVTGTGKTTLISIISSALGIRDLRQLEHHRTNIPKSYLNSIYNYFSFSRKYADGIIGDVTLSNNKSYMIYDRQFYNSSCTLIPCDILHGFRFSSDRYSINRRFYPISYSFLYFLWYTLTCCTLGLLSIALSYSMTHYMIIINILLAILFLYITLEFISYTPISGNVVSTNAANDILRFAKSAHFWQSDHSNIPLIKTCLRIVSSICPEANKLKLADSNSRIVSLSSSGSEIDINQVSHGSASILEIVWRLCLLERFGSPYVVLMDEPEIHLHPGLQRRFLHILIKSFPNAQFIIATHSPFIMGAYPDAHVFILKQVEKGHVSSYLLTDLNKGGSANELLRDAFELTFTQGLWVEDQVRTILKEYIGKEITTNLIDEMHDILSAQGLEQTLPEALSCLASGAWLSSKTEQVNDKA